MFCLATGSAQMERFRKKLVDFCGEYFAHFAIVFFSSSLQLICLFAYTIILIIYDACTYWVVLVISYCNVSFYFLFVSSTCFVVFLFMIAFVSQRCGMKSGSVYCFICFLKIKIPLTFVALLLVSEVTVDVEEMMLITAVSYYRVKLST